MTPIMQESYVIDWTDIGDLQKFIHRWANATFPGRQPDSSLFKLAMEELPELLQHKKRCGTDGIGDELADCFILLLDLATIWDVDIALAIRRKMRVNMNRTWVEDKSTGFYNHVEREPAPPDSEGGET